MLSLELNISKCSLYITFNAKAEGGSSHTPIIEEEDHHLPSKGWAEMIRKIYEVVFAALSLFLGN